MRFALRRPLIIFMLALAALAATVSSADASTSQFTAMQDDGLLQSPNTAVRDSALNEMQELGVETVKVALIWHNVAPGADSSSKPSGFNSAEPTGYNFGLYRSLVDAIVARGMNAWLIINTPAPRWAAPKKSLRYPNVWQPDPDEFGAFAEATGKAFPDVHTFSVLNEPNHEHFLQPQAKKRGVVWSAVLYRNLYYMARAGFADSGHDGDQILFGAMAPRASAVKKGAKSVHPVAFLRQMFCLDDKLRPARGRLAKDLKCTGKYKRIDAKGFAYHPYTNSAGPLSGLPNKDDAMIGQLPRLYKVLDRAAALKRLSTKRIKLWNAEFGYQTYPPDACWAKIKKVPEYINFAEYMSWKDPRVANYQQYQLTDEPSEGLCDRRFQAGLRFVDGSKKPSIYDAFQMPIVVERVTGKKVKVWGGIRAFNGTPQTVEIQVKSGSGFNTVASVLVTNSGGYFQTTVPLAGASGKTWRIIWNGQNSRSTKPVPKVKPRR